MKQSRLLVVMFMLALYILLVSSAAFADSEDRMSGAYSYRIKGNGTVAITGFDWKNNNADIYIPNMLDGYTVSEIGEEAFARNVYKDNDDKDSVVVTLPNTITTIGEKAFFNTAITSIIIPESVEAIGGGAFANCRNITRFSVASGNRTYSVIDGVLYNKKTKTLIAYPLTKSLTAIPEGIVAIGDYAFYSKDFLSGGIAKHFPASIKEVGKWAFAETKMNLYKDGFLPANVETIDDYAFYNCKVNSQKDWTAAIDVPATLTSIGNHAFEGMELPGYGIYGDYPTLKFYGKDLSIGDYAFYNASLEVGFGSMEGKFTAGEYAFSNISASCVWFDEIKQNCKLEELTEGIFKNTHVANDLIDDGDDYIYGLEIAGRYKLIPKEAFRLGGYAEKSKDVLQIDIRKGIKEIGEYAFADRPALKKVMLPFTLTIIGDGAFANCLSLESITIPEKVEEIGENAFSNCPSLSGVYIPASTESIGENAFDRDTITLTVESGSYAERWARDNGYAYGYPESDDLSWLNN